MAGENNILFLFDNAAMRGAVSASSEAAGLPATNLQKRQRSRVWRGTNGTTENIDFTLAADESTPISMAALVDHNLSPLGTIRLRGWSDAIDGADKLVDVTIEPWAGLSGYGVGGYGVGGYGGAPTSSVQALIRPVTFLPLDGFYDCLYWRYTLTDETLDYIQAGVAYLGDHWQPKTNMSWGSSLGREPRTKKRRSRGGQDYGNAKSGRAYFDFNLSWLSSADRDSLWLRYLAAEDHTSFIFSARPTEGVELLMNSLYGNFDPFEMVSSHHNNSQAKIRIVEAL